jgi:hypothetical protein
MEEGQSGWQEDAVSHRATDGTNRRWPWLNFGTFGGTMNAELSQQEIVDLEHLRLLRIGYFISAATNLLWVFFPLIYVIMGAFMLFGGFGGAKPSDAPPKSIGLVFITIGFAISMIMASFSVLKLLTAQAIGKRRWKGLILATAAISCLGVPWGTALGVLTFVVLTRPSIASKFSNST